MTAEQLEAARAERMRQNGHGAISIEDVRTWIEETGLCIFLPRSAQAGQGILPAPTFIEAIAGQRTPEPTSELIATAESLLVRLEAEGVAVRLNLSGQPAGSHSDQPDYVVASWVLPYIYALRGDRDWRRSPQLTGSRQVSQLAVQAAKQIDGANQTAAQIRDALGREVTETAVLRALHELWKQLRIIPVVPEAGQPALWQPLRQRFQKAIAEGASTSQVTAISVLASIYLQAVIAASMEDVEMFLSPLTSRSKIREVVRGLAATRQVHSTTMGHSPMFYVAGTLPEFPAVPSFQISGSLPAYRNGNYRGTGYRSSSTSSYLGHVHEDDGVDSLLDPSLGHSYAPIADSSEEEVFPAALAAQSADSSALRRKTNPVKSGPAKPGSAKANPAKSGAAASGGPAKARSGKSATPRPRAMGSSSSAGDRRRAPAPRGIAAVGNSRGPGGGRSHGAAAAGANGIKPVEREGASNGAPKRFRFAAQAAGASQSNGKPTIKPVNTSGIHPVSHASANGHSGKSSSANGAGKAHSGPHSGNGRPPEPKRRG